MIFFNLIWTAVLIIWSWMLWKHPETVLKITQELIQSFSWLKEKIKEWRSK